MGDEHYDANMARFEVSGDPQDLDPRIGFHRRRDRLIAEIIGMLRISLCDGVISEAEARALHDWIRGNPDTSFIYPVKQLKERLDRAFADGILDPDEQRELQEFGRRFQPDADAYFPAPSATKLPLDDPAPLLAFAGQQFVFTGTFVSGTRKWCEEQVTARGGFCKSKVVQTMSVLVIGDLATHNWIQTTHGRKIEEVMRLKTSGFQIHVVDEPHFVSQL